MYLCSLLRSSRQLLYAAFFALLATIVATAIHRLTAVVGDMPKTTGRVKLSIERRTPFYEIFCLESDF